MPLDLTHDCTFSGPALPAPFVKFNLEAELNRLGLLPKATGPEARALNDHWQFVRRKPAILIMTEAAALALVGELVFLQPAPFASCPENYFYRLLDSSSPFRYFSVSGPTTSHSGAAGPP